MALTAWRTMIMGAFVFAGVALLGASCGGAGSDTCTRAGAKCALGCEPNLGCVSCGSNADCGPGAPFCVLGDCEACVTSKDCGAGQACFPEHHECRTACASNANCTDSDAPLCNLMTGACVGCLTNMNCPPDHPICEPTRSQCSECSLEVPCGAATPACNLQDGECEQCLVDADCNGAFVCGGDHKCHPICKTNAECTDQERPICNVETGGCVGCLINQNCPAGAPVCRPDGRCGCLVNMDCPLTLPFCRDNNECVQCLDDVNCPAATPKCDKHICVP
jgi:hypothetical protein